MTGHKRRFQAIVPEDKSKLDALIAAVQTIVLEAKELDKDSVALPMIPKSGLAQHEVMMLTGITLNFVLDKNGLVFYSIGSDAIKDLQTAYTLRSAINGGRVLSIAPAQETAIPAAHQQALKSIAFHMKRHMNLENVGLSTLGAGQYCLSTERLTTVLANEALNLSIAVGAFNPDIHYSFDGDELRVRVKVSM